MATLAAAAGYMRGTLHGDDSRFDGVSTDTRTIREGELFVALEGPNFDGRDYIDVARDKGAAGAVVSTLVDDAAAEIPQIVVGDSRRALGQLGSAWRDQLAVTVIGITGSNGKTTLKEMTAACLAGSASTLATMGNLNNDIGMPLMLTRIEKGHRFAVLEMGANHVGEIAYLTAIARPDIVAITNAGEAHLEGFGSVDGIARGKGEILCGEYRPGVAILNADDHYFEYWSTLVEDTRRISFGIEAPADVYATEIASVDGGSRFRLCVPGGEAAVALPIAGRHNVRNACAATAIAIAAGIDIADIKLALENIEPVAGRLCPVDGPSGATVYDDSYNANPLSVVAAAEFLATLNGVSVLVLGDMYELGHDAPRFHRETGEKVRAAGVDRLLATGDLSRSTADGFGDGATWYPNVEALVDALRDELRPGLNVLVKGSRGMQMERVVEAIRADATERGEG
jgi:UDP-N-acetylmuramoyl-tripeptide--D-alanyl-D-alanine ligase